MTTSGCWLNSRGEHAVLLRLGAGFSCCPPPDWLLFAGFSLSVLLWVSVGVILQLSEEWLALSQLAGC